MKTKIPKEIINTALVLLLALVSTFTGTYLDMGFYTESKGYDPYIYSIDIIWALIVFWLIWDLIIKKKDLRIILLILSVIILILSIWNTYEYGFLYSTITGIFELGLYLWAYYMLASDGAKLWYKLSL